MNSDQFLKEIKKIVDTTDKILITGQPDPDGDSLGSQLALHDILLQQKHHDGRSEEVEIVISNDSLPPPHYGFLPKIHLLTPYEKIKNRRFEVGFVIDSGTDRVGKVFPILQKCQRIITIDHHQSRAQGIEHISWLDPNICSVAEMIYDFFDHPEWHVALTPDIAAGLYTGIIYDTGSFRYPKTTSRTHQIAAKLLETRIDFAKISERLFLERTFSGVQVFGTVLQNLQRDPTGEVIWGTITQALLKRFQVRLEESEGIITQYAFTKGTKVAVLFKEASSTKVKVSFRAKGAIDVGQFAKKLSEKGGGHPRAAGCTIKGTIEDVRKLVIYRLQQELKESYS